MLNYAKNMLNYAIFWQTLTSYPIFCSAAKAQPSAGGVILSAAGENCTYFIDRPNIYDWIYVYLISPQVFLVPPIYTFGVFGEIIR